MDKLNESDQERVNQSFAHGVESFTEEDLEKQYQEIADMYQMPIENVKSVIDPSMLSQDIANQKAMDFLKGKTAE